jgi:hypothetical protein
MLRASEIWDTPSNVDKKKKRAMPAATTSYISIVKEESYRSKPQVNMSDDMVRVVITLPKREWPILKRDLLGRI